MRIVGVVVLVSLLATLGLLACVPVTLTPAVPAATATPAPTVAWTPIPTPPPPPTPAIPAGTPTKTTKGTYTGGNLDVSIDLKTGDVVVVTVTSYVGSSAVSIDNPTRMVVMMPYTLALDGSSKGKQFVFQAKVDGAYHLMIQGGNSPDPGLVNYTIDVYSK